MAFLHPFYRKMVTELQLVDRYELPTVLKLLRRYANIYFRHNWNPKKENPDLQLLFSNLNELLRCSSSVVIMELSNIYLDFPKESRVRECVVALLRFLNMSSETKMVILQQLQKIGHQFPKLMARHY